MKIIFSFLAISLMILSTFSIFIPQIKADPRTIIVPDDYATIQEAINHANEGDTIFVSSGTYYEHVIIDKSLSLIGENKNETIIDGNHSGKVVYLTADNISIISFKIQNSGPRPWPYYESGIYVNASSHCNIKNNIIVNNCIGIYLVNSSSNILTSNDGSNNRGDYGIILQYSHNNTFDGNTASSNRVSGIRIKFSKNNLLVNNTASYNDDGETGGTVGEGIMLYEASHNTFVNNKICANKDFGISFHDSSNNRVLYNDVIGNIDGIEFDASHNNTIAGNNISNRRGIKLRDSSTNNVIYHNVFTNAWQQAETDGSPNIWDDGYPSGGNYWSDYTGVDFYSGPFQNVTGNDGIGDSPYVIDANNIDNYPLMQPWTAVPVLSSNLIHNAGFEGRLAFWLVSSGTAFFMTADWESYSGLLSARGFETSESSLGRLYQDVTDRVTVDRNYTISGYIKTENVEGNATIGLHYVDTNGFTVEEIKEIGYVSGTTDWQYFESDDFKLPSMPAGADSLWFFVDFENGTGTAFWDDLSLNEVIYMRPDDLELSRIQPVQVVYDAPALVINKPTLVRVDIRNSFETDVTANIEVSWDSFTHSEQLEIPPLKTSTFHLPSDEFMVFTEHGTHTISVVIDSNETIAESDETNNEISITVTVKDTKELELLYRGVNFPWEAGQPSQSELQEMNSFSSWFINGTYPTNVIQNETHDFPYVISGLSLTPGAGVAFTLWDLSLQAVLSEFDKVVGVVRQDFFRDHTWWTLASPDIKGLSLSSAAPRAVLVETGYWPATAHEIGHTYGLQDEYDIMPYPRSTGNWASGYWVARRQFLETYCFMGAAPDRKRFDRWIENECYGQLFNELKTGLDPEVIFVGGLIFQNGTTELFPWYRIPTGTIDFPFGSKGNYSLVFTDNQSNILGQVGFNLSFTVAETTYNASVFAFTVPYVPETSEILLIKDNSTMAQRTVSQNSPQVTVIYPNGGETLVESNTYTLTWEATDPDNDALTYSVLFSEDGGGSWLTLATNLYEKSFNLTVPSGLVTTNALIKVIASDSVNTGQDFSDDVFTIVTKPEVPVGGIWITPNKFELLAPWIGLALITIVLMVVTLVFVKFEKKKRISELTPH